LREVRFYNESGQEIYGQAVLTKRNREILTCGPRRMPATVRVGWLENSKT